jgi:photosystem II stability/assembly factor-like uncharacterized protein
MNELESRLRATLADRATHAPAGAALAERILAEVEAPARVLRPRHGWRTWTMPVLAAAAVAAVVAAVVGLQGDRPLAAPQPPAVSQPVTAPVPLLSTAPGPTRSATGRVVAPAPGAVAKHVSKPTAVGVQDFMALSTTFVNATEGWALGTSTCLDAGSQTNGDGTCSAMLHTTDGGTSWASTGNPPGNTPTLGCAKPCISSIRFATDQIGYAFSDTTLEMTTDGGHSWTTSPGGASALETLDGNVIRVRQVPGCSAALCREQVETAPIGSLDWTVVEVLPARVNEYGVDTQAQLVRSGSRAALLTFANLAAQGPEVPSAALYTSTDDGHSWSRASNPCSSVGRLTASAVDLALDGSLHLLCTDHAESNPRFVALTSTDGGVRYTASPALPIVPDNGWLAAASADTLFVPTISGLVRTTDGGRTWQRVIRVTAGGRGAPGFADDQTGRWLSNSGRTIWTTHDAGRTWRAFDFS